MKRLQYVLVSIILCGCVSTVSLQEMSNYEQGKAALAAKSYGLAQSKFQLALNDVGTKAHALNGLAATFYEMNNDVSALEFIRSARAIDTKSEFLKNNEAKILARMNATQASNQAAAEFEPVKLGKVDVTPAVIDLTAGSAMLPLREGRPQIEATSTRPAAGYERRLPTAQLEQITPGVFNLVLMPRREEVAAKQDLSEIANVLASVRAAAVQGSGATTLSESGTSVLANTKTIRPRRIALDQTERSMTRIAIANGSGVKGIACSKAESLRKAGISVASCSDYKTKDGKVNFKQTETVLYINRQSRLDPELILALIRSSDAKRLVVTNLNNAKLDVQVVLGKDSRVTARRV
jgi:LytR cell envelope-related transcriptional attenuator